MTKSHLFGLSLVASAVTLGVAPAIEAQDDDLQTQEVREAENELERAEDRLERAEESVEQHEEALEDAIADAADSGSEESEPSESPDLDGADWEALTAEHPDLSTFVEALRVTGLEDTLAGGEDYTVFAPVDEAFEERDVDDLLSEENREDLVELLRAHIVADDVDPVRARTLQEALTVDGGRVALTMEDETLRVGDAEVVNSDIRLGNLRIYPIDGVLDANADTDIALGDFD